MNEILDYPIQTGSEQLTNEGCDIVFDHLLLYCAPNHLQHPSATIVLEDDNFLITLPVDR